MGRYVAMAEDLEHGFVDRLRSRVAGAYMVVNNGVRPVGALIGGLIVVLAQTGSFVPAAAATSHAANHPRAAPAASSARV